MIKRPSFSGSGQKQSAQVTTLPASIKGIDTRQVLSHMSPDVCVYDYNLLPSSYGMTLRKGYREHFTKIAASQMEMQADPENRAAPFPMGVRSILIFNGSMSGTSTDDRMFAVANNGIYDITDPTQPAVLKIRFWQPYWTAGFGVDLRYTDEGGQEYLFYADELNGLFRYSKNGERWELYRGITGVIAEDIVFITVHKQRIWIATRYSSIGWYLPVGATAGAATPFHFGSLFKHGGDLKGVYNWSIDGGAGVDDILVAISTTGDVLPFKGEDPSSADTWSIIGAYYIGDTPVGRRITNEFGGNLYVLSSYGIVSMADLLRGVDPKDVSSNSLTYKISPLLIERLKSSLSNYLWELVFASSEGKFIVNSPKEWNKPQIQYVMDMITEGWGMWRGLPITCMKEWDGKLYFGSGFNVYVIDGTRDNALKDVPDGEDNGSPIEFSLLTSFQAYDAPGVKKMIQLIRPDFLCSTQPDYSIKAVYDYRMDEIAIPFSEVPLPGGKWDASNWDECVWEGGALKGKSLLHGADGIGRSAAIALRGSSSSELKLISIDVMWKTGGVL